MRKTSILAAAIIVLIPLGLSAQDEGFYPYSYARLSYVNGSVYVQRASDLGYEKGEINLALVQGDKMGTENGQAEVHFGRRNYLRLDANTKVEFAVLPQEGDERIKLHLTEGNIYLRISQLALEKGVEVHSPDASYYVLEEGLYRFDVEIDRETSAYVHEGSLEAASAEGSVLVRVGEMVTAVDGRLAGDPRDFYAREDSFDVWNGSRDTELGRRSERQYLPSDLGEYEEELDSNGDWIYERPYGYVWVPRVVHADWRPYLYGRWVWYPVIGWTWVSSEPWGWSVYHYGRWHWRFGLGWYWIPRVHWGPAWVHWWWDNDYIGWCPLSWYNRPIVIVNNYFYDRYYDRDFPVHNRAFNVIRRNSLQASNIARHRLNAGELGRVNRVALRAEQPSIRPAVDNARPQALAAKRALAVRPGSRSAIKAVPPAGSVSSGRLSRGSVSSRMRSREAGPAAANTARDRISRPVVRDSASGGRAIRSYPSRRQDGGGAESTAAVGRRPVVAAPNRGSRSEVRENPSRIVSPRGVAPSPAPKASSEQRDSKVRKNASQSQSGVIKKSGAVRDYPSSTSSERRTYASRTGPAARTFRPDASRREGPSLPRVSGRANSPTDPGSRSTATRQAPQISQPAPSRAGSPGYSRPGSSRPSAPSRSNASALSRSGSSRPSAPSAGRGSFSAPSRSGGSGRSMSAPRSSGSSSGRSSSPGRSSSSSSRSGSSSKSGSVKRKG